MNLSKNGLKASTLPILLLLYGIALHLWFLHSVPDPFFFNDSEGYLKPAFDSLFGGGWRLASIRTPGYPCFLLLVLKFSHHLAPVLWLQHLGWLLIALLAALILKSAFNASPVSVALSGFFVLVLPRGLVYSHAILTDAPFTLLGLALVSCFLWAVKTSRPLAWGLTGLIAAVSMAFRPVGVIWAAALLVSALLYKGRSLWPQLRIALAAFMIGLLPLCTYNYVTQRHFGTQQIMGLALFGPAAPYLEPSRVSDERVRGILTPFYSTPEDRARLYAPAWVRNAPEGPVQTLARELPPTVNQDRLLARLSVQAILDHPFRYFGRQVRAYVVFFVTSCMRPNGQLSKEHSVFEGLLIFDRLARVYPAIRSYVVFRAIEAGTYQDWMLNHPTYPYEPGPLPFLLIWPYAWLVGALPLGALLSSVLLWKNPPLRFPLQTFWLVIFFHILVSNLSSGGLQIRYALPIEPLYVILVVAGLAASVQRLRNVPQENSVSNFSNGQPL